MTLLATSNTATCVIVGIRRGVGTLFDASVPGVWLALDIKNGGNSSALFLNSHFIIVVPLPIHHHQDSIHS
jgi:hypothetical protein